MRGLLEWLDDPADNAGVRIFGQGMWAERVSYRSLAGRVHEIADHLLRHRLTPGGVVVIGLPTGLDFLASYFGVLRAGGIPSTVPTIALGQGVDAFVDHLAAILRVARPDVVLVDPSTESLLAKAVSTAGLEVQPIGLDDVEPGASAVRPPADLGLIQFTSGSSGSPRGVELAYGNLEANVHMIRRWLAMEPDHATATWLPLYHDMGLIGTMITPTVNQSDLYMMKPADFIQRPQSWLECFGRHGVRITAAPPFCLSHLLRTRKRGGETRFDGMDFAGWEVFITGAENVDPALLHDFADWLEPWGFQAEALMPAYGLAEATLAVTGVRPGVRPRCIEVDRSTIALGREVRALRSVDCSDQAVTGGTSWITSCGPPLDAVSVRIVDGQGNPVDTGHLGEIVVSAPSTSRGYRGTDTSGSSGFDDDGSLRTGDTGFLADGELYVLGRMGDSMKVRGRAVFLQDLETRLAKLPGAKPDRFTVVGGSSMLENHVVVLIESEGPEWRRHAMKLLRQELGTDVRTRFVNVAAGVILRTSSGKPRRRVLWEQLQAGEIVEREDGSDQARAEADT